MQEDAFLSFYWFGHPLVKLAGQPVKFEMRKSLALLAYLSLERRAISREGLADLFWPEFDQKHALASLRRSLSSLNGCIPGSFLEINRQGVNLIRNEQVWGDVTSFQEQVQHAGRHAHPDGVLCPECLSALEEAAKLYQGEFFEGFNLPDCPDFDEWQFARRESLRQIFEHVLQQLVWHYSSLGLYQNAIPFARRWVALDPLHEPAQRILMDLYAQAGQRSIALRQFEDFSRILKQELQQLPENETVDLARSIREADSSSSQREIPSTNSRYTGISLVKTKLYIPDSRSKVVGRARLMHSLEQIADYPITIISAPAGFGKTTALAEWIHRTDLPIAWVSLDSADNHLTRFLAYLTAALESIDAGLVTGVAELLRSSQPIPSQVILTELLHNIEKSTASFALVLDDYQFINTQSVHEAVAFLCAHLPSPMHLVIATRVDPPLPLAKIRISGRLMEIRMDDLRFDEEETIAYLNQAMKLNLSQTQVQKLNTQTEGWIAGLQMAAISLRRYADPEQFIQNFSGSDRYILDYLVEEVINQQHPYIQQFLLKTSALDRLCGPLCDAVMGEEVDDSPFPSSQLALEYLDRSNLFLIPLDNQRYWFRYHHLFSDLLRARQHQYFGNNTRTIHARAALWYEQYDLMVEAVRHSLSAQEYDQAARLIERIARAEMDQGNSETILNLIQAIPEDILQSYPNLATFKASALIYMGAFEEAERMIHQVETQLQVKLEEAVPDITRFGLLMLKAQIADISGDWEQAVAIIQSMAQVMPADEALGRAMVDFRLADSYHTSGDLIKASQIHQKYINASGEITTAGLRISEMCEVARIFFLQGKLNRAHRLYQEALQTISQQGEKLRLYLGRIYPGCVDVLREWNRLAEAKDVIEPGIEAIRRTGIPNVIAFGYAIQSRVRLACGDLNGAFSALEEAERFLPGFRYYQRTGGLVKSCRARLLLAAGEVEKAWQWLEKNGLHEDDSLSFVHELEHIELCRIFIAKEQPQKAVSLSTRLADAAEQFGRTYRLVEILAIQAIALHQVGETEHAVQQLAKSLLLAAGEHYSRTYLDLGEPMADLLRYKNNMDHLRDASLSTYSRELIRSFDESR